MVARGISTPRQAKIFCWQYKGNWQEGDLPLRTPDASPPVIKVVGLKAVFPTIGALAQTSLLPLFNMTFPELVLLARVVLMKIPWYMPSFF
jgi:hypothetical protein